MRAKNATVGIAVTIILLLAYTLAHSWTGFATQSFDLFTMTKVKKYYVKKKLAVVIYPSATANVQLNGKGNTYPLAANTEFELGIFRNVSSLTFTCTSTAAASPVSVRVQVQE